MNALPMLDQELYTYLLTEKKKKKRILAYHMTDNQVKQNKTTSVPAAFILCLQICCYCFVDSHNRFLHV